MNNSYWDQNTNYYVIASETNLKANKKLLEKLFNYSKNAKFIIDVGCGEGSVLNSLKNNDNELYGIDVSNASITMALKKYNHNYKIYNGTTIPYDNNFFDLSYSTYVLEHLENPEEYIKETIRVTKPGGKIIFIFPNYGSLIFKSPCSHENLLYRSIKIFLKHIKCLFQRKSPELIWNKTTILTNCTYFPDCDTLCEPDIITLKGYFKYNNCRIIYTKTTWTIENFSRKKILNFIGQLLVYPLWFLRIPPFKNYGLNSIIIAEKKSI